MRTRVLLIVLAAASGLGCRDARVQAVTDAWFVTPESIEFGEVHLGVRRTRQLIVHNVGTAPIEVTFESAAPFGVDRGRLQVPGGAQAEVSLSFQPSVLGSATGEAILQAGGNLVRVALQGTAVSPPACVSLNPCQTGRFSSALDACEEVPIPNGTSCEAPCIFAGACFAGECRGQSVDCDDHDPCTVDACASNGECVHPPLECPQTAGLCSPTTCDPAVGCVPTALGDGAVCDDGRICEAGACLWPKITPEQTCAQPTPCAPAGVWNGTQCIRPPTPSFEPKWRYDIEPKQLIDPVVDQDDNVYWTEQGGNGTGTIVSVDRDGHERFRRTFPGGWNPNLVVLDDALFMLEVDRTYPSRNLVVARSKQDGSELWRRSFLAEAGLSDGTTLWLVRQEAGRLLLEVSQDWNDHNDPVILMCLDERAGNILWKRTFPAQTFVTGVDDAGRVFVTTYPFALEVLDHDGTTLWSTPYEQEPGDAAYGGYLLEEDGKLRSARTGDLISELSVQGCEAAYRTNPRFSVPGLAMWLGTERAPNDNWYRSTSLPTHLFMQPLPTGTPHVVAPEDGHGFDALSDVLLTSRGTFLFAADDGAGGFSLKEVRTTGEVAYQCPLPYLEPPCCPGSPIHQYSDHELLLKDRWIVAGRAGSKSVVMGFEVKGAETPRHGSLGAMGIR